MHRGWQDDPLFKGEPFSRRDAWEWIIANAAYEAHFQWFNGHRHRVDRGQIIISLTSVAKAWKWSVQRVRTFLGQLEIDEKVARSTDSGATRLTVCNYEKYQTKQHDEEQGEAPNGNKGATRDQHTTEEEKENKKEELMPDKAGDYAFFGQIIKLAPRHLSEWKRRFYSILDLDAELSVLDEWWHAQPEDKRKNWFLATKGMLNKRHQQNLAAVKQADEPVAWDGMA